MTLLVPGSAQLMARDKRVGVWAIRIWAGVILAVLSWIGLLMVNRGAAVAVISSKPVIVVMVAVLALGGIGWAGLLLHAWKLSHPISLAPRHRLAFGGVSLVLALALSGTGLASASVVNAQGDFIGSVFAGGGDTAVKDGRYNVLLLGGDAGAGRDGLRPDSLTLASVDAKTGQTVFFSIPRNLEDFSFPAYSPMRKLYPDKFTCPGHECMLSAVYTRATENRGLYPGVRDPGALATVEAVEWITGLDVNYYVLADLHGFKALVDAVGGITLDIGKPVPIGGGSTEVGRYIPAGADVHLNGQDALWFAQSQHESNDDERMVRQKCVMHAMLHQHDPVAVSTKFTEIGGAGKDVMTSNVPSGERDRLIDLTVKARETEVRSVAFVPPLIYPGAPDFTVIRSAVQERIASSGTPVPAGSPSPDPVPVATAAATTGATTEPTATSSPSSTRRATAAPTPTPAQAAKRATGNPGSGYSAAGNPVDGDPADTDDLAVVCRAF